jgi:hypothetical protein
MIVYRSKLVLFLYLYTLPPANGSDCGVDGCSESVSNFSCEWKVDINPRKKNLMFSLIFRYGWREIKIALTLCLLVFADGRPITCQSGIYISTMRLYYATTSPTVVQSVLQDCVGSGVSCLLYSSTCPGLWNECVIFIEANELSNSYLPFCRPEFDSVPWELNEVDPTLYRQLQAFRVTWTSCYVYDGAQSCISSLRWSKGFFFL